ncbi:MAG: glycosyltransferase [Paludibacter sp.]|nr:glycosyltransferase [Paludibacter sp.]
MENLILSVWIITYNQEKYISECLNSILMQHTNFEFEIVIGEDHSTDITRTICEKYAKEHSNIILLPLEHNLGLVKNWERTLFACQGKYIAMCEGDDYWIDSYKLQKQIDFLENNKSYSMCVSNRKVLLTDGTFYDDISIKECYTKEDILKGVIPHTQTMVFRNLNREAMCEYLSKLLSGLFSEGDRVLSYWCSKFGDIYILPDQTAVYRWNGIGVWSGHTAIYREYFFIRMFCTFHKRIEYPDRKLFGDSVTTQCLDFIYYNFKRGIKNRYKLETLKLLYKELTFIELIVNVFNYIINKFHKNKK